MVTVQSVFCLEIYQNNVFILFFKDIKKLIKKIKIKKTRFAPCFQIRS